MRSGACGKTHMLAMACALAPGRQNGAANRRRLLRLLAQMRSAKRITRCLSLEAKRKTPAPCEYFAFWAPNGHADRIERCPFLGSKLKTYAQRENFAF